MCTVLLLLQQWGRRQDLLFYPTRRWPWQSRSLWTWLLLTLHRWVFYFHVCTQRAHDSTKHSASSPNTNTNFFKKLIFTGVCVFTQSCPTLCDPLDYSPPGYPFHGIFSGKNSGVSCYFLLQGIFLTQGLNLCLISFVSCIAGGFFTR